MPKLDTLAQLVEAYKNGELHEPLWLDNDSTSVVDDNEEPVPGLVVFEMHPDDLLEQALDLLGVPHEHV